MKRNSMGTGGRLTGLWEPWSRPVLPAASRSPPFVETARSRRHDPDLQGKYNLFLFFRRVRFSFDHDPRPLFLFLNPFLLLKTYLSF